MCKSSWITFTHGYPKAWGALECQEGYQVRPKIHMKRVFFHSQALYVHNMNRVSNSCKIALKGCDFFEILGI